MALWLAMLGHKDYLETRFYLGIKKSRKTLLWSRVAKASRLYSESELWAKAKWWCWLLMAVVGLSNSNSDNTSRNHAKASRQFQVHDTQCIHSSRLWWKIPQSSSTTDMLLGFDHVHETLLSKPCSFRCLGRLCIPRGFTLASAQFDGISEAVS